MSIVLFMRGMLLALSAFAIAIYFLTGSFWTALVQTIICAVILQVGYFLAVLFQVWRVGHAGEPAKLGDTVKDPTKVGGDVLHKHF